MPSWRPIQASCTDQVHSLEQVSGLAITAEEPERWARWMGDFNSFWAWRYRALNTSLSSLTHGAAFVSGSTAGQFTSAILTIYTWHGQVNAVSRLPVAVGSPIFRTTLQGELPSGFLQKIRAFPEAMSQRSCSRCSSQQQHGVNLVARFTPQARRGCLSAPTYHVGPGSGQLKRKRHECAGHVRMSASSPALR